MRSFPHRSARSFVQRRIHSLCALIIACPLSRTVWSRCSSAWEPASRSGSRCWARWNQPCQSCCWASIQRRSSTWACCTFFRRSVGLPDVTWTRPVQSRSHLAWASSVSCTAVCQAFTVSFQAILRDGCSVPCTRSSQLVNSFCCASAQVVSRLSSEFFSLINPFSLHQSMLETRRSFPYDDTARGEFAFLPENGRSMLRETDEARRKPWP